jgi:hypothetical protein
MGKPAGKPKVGAVEIATAQSISWEASDQQQDARRHLLEVAFFTSGCIFASSQYV